MKKNFYTIKFITKPFRLNYQKNNMCSNFCMLYYSKNINFTEYRAHEHAV